MDIRIKCFKQTKNILQGTMIRIKQQLKPKKSNDLFTVSRLLLEKKKNHVSNIKIQKLINISRSRKRYYKDQDTATCSEELYQSELCHESFGCEEQTADLPSPQRRTRWENRKIKETVRGNSRDPFLMRDIYRIFYKLFTKKRNSAFSRNSSFLILKSWQPNIANLWYFKVRLSYLTEFRVSITQGPCVQFVDKYIELEH